MSTVMSNAYIDTMCICIFVVYIYINTCITFLSVAEMQMNFPVPVHTFNRKTSTQRKRFKLSPLPLNLHVVESLVSPIDQAMREMKFLWYSTRSASLNHQLRPYIYIYIYIYIERERERDGGGRFISNSIIYTGGTLIKDCTHHRHPIRRLHGRAMGCLLRTIRGKLTAL